MRSENGVGDSLGMRLIFYLLLLSYTARIKNWKCEFKTRTGNNIMPINGKSKPIKLNS